ncbi:hypothetical protein FRC12_009667 [Ceratobasidium sp. 428]|nr:hypothetical protein FRC12_009667 [Ceratobasidium sp. 428]
MNDNRVIPALLIGGALSGIFYSWYRSQGSVPLPPGPKGHVIFGSALEVSTDAMFGDILYLHQAVNQIQNSGPYWLKLSEYNDQYGPIVCVRMLHKRMFVISDPNLISELFEKRAANYSDRNISGMARLIGWDKNVVFTPYGPLLKRYRTMLQRALNNRVSLDYIPLQQYEIQRFMRRLIDQPGEFMAHVHLMAASIAVRIAYGYKVNSADDHIVQAAEELMSAFSDIAAPARWAVNILPLLRYLPEWFPLISFHRRARDIRRMDAVAQNEPFEYVLKQMAEGTAEDSFTSKLLQPDDGQPIDDETKEQIKSVASTLYGAGSDTTVSGVQSFFLAMTLYPDVQAKAQAEIATYLKQRSTKGDPSRMILPADRPNLPYTSAIVHEVLRWHPITNMVAHRSSDQDDCNVVSGGKVYRILAQSLVMANIWKIMHDPDVYIEPGKFRPERYLAENPPPEPENYAFGFGRRYVGEQHDKLELNLPSCYRICPGLHIAQQSMWISISNTLANFTITKARDENGMEITPEERYSTGLISHPLPFKCSITPKEGCEEWLREVTE